MADSNDDSLPHIVVLGSGFGGLNFCKRFAGRARVSVVDKQNHHLFQPLLYQVATAGLTAPDIAAPIRHVLAGKSHCQVWMDEVVGLDVEDRRVDLRENDPLDYDYLVFGLGGITSFFGHDEWRAHALPLKTLDDAMAIRWQLLQAFERAEMEDDPDEQKRLMTILICGAGPTGVELAGACAELTRRVFRKDYQNIDTARTRIVLLEAMDRVLPMYPEGLSHKAGQQLRELGVETITGAMVQDVQHGRVTAGEQRYEAENILWGAGVNAHPLTEQLGVEKRAKGGRIPVEPDLSVPGHPEVFVIGDSASVNKADGSPVPGVAPAAMQMGEHVGSLLTHELAPGAKRTGRRQAFHYRDHGVMSTLGRSRAVAWLYNRYQLSGTPAWLVWLGVHLFFLIGFRNRIAVLLQWFYGYITFQRGARIIYGATRLAASAREEVTSEEGKSRG